MNTTQIQTTAAPLVAFFAGLLAGKGVFGLDAATWATVIGAIVGLGGTIWAAVSTRQKAIINEAGNQPGTTVITTPAIANALPSNADVIASTPQIVSAVNASK